MCVGELWAVIICINMWFSSKIFSPFTVIVPFSSLSYMSFKCSIGFLNNRRMYCRGLYHVQWPGGKNVGGGEILKLKVKFLPSPLGYCGNNLTISSEPCCRWLPWSWILSQILISSQTSWKLVASGKSKHISFWISLHFPTFWKCAGI